MWVTSLPNWRICEAHSIFGFDERYRPTIAKFVKPGDVACVYVTGLKGTQLIGFVGLVAVTEVSLDHKDSVGWMRPKRGTAPTPEIYPHRVAWRWISKATSALRIDPKSGSRLEELEYFTDKSRSWYSFVYPSIARLPEADLVTVLKWISKGPPSEDFSQTTV